MLILMQCVQALENIDACAVCAGVGVVGEH